MPEKRNIKHDRRWTLDILLANLRSSAFICGSFFAEASYSKDSDRINRIDRINPSTNPVNPVNPVRSSFSTAPDINRIKFIKPNHQNSVVTCYSST